MAARMLADRGRSRVRLSVLLGLLPLLACAGCGGLGNRHAARKIPQYGFIDPEQPRELHMSSMPAYVVEPPDELEIAVRPAIAELSLNTVVVQPDGNIDLGFLGDVYVAGLTLQQVEQKIALHLNAVEKPPAGQAS